MSWPFISEDGVAAISQGEGGVFDWKPPVEAVGVGEPTWDDFSKWAIDEELTGGCNVLSTSSHASIRRRQDCQEYWRPESWTKRSDICSQKLFGWLAKLAPCLRARQISRSASSSKAVRALPRVDAVAVVVEGRCRRVPLGRNRGDRGFAIVNKEHRSH